MLNSSSAVKPGFAESPRMVKYLSSQINLAKKRKKIKEVFQKEN